MATNKTTAESKIPTSFLVFAMLFAVLVAASLAGCGDSSKQPESQSDTATDEKVAGPRDSVAVVLDGKDSTSVFELLQGSHQVEFTRTSMGVFVSGIDSVVNGSDHYWVYSVNDTMGMKASDKFITHDGDRVVWHFRGPSR